MSVEPATSETPTQRRTAFSALGSMHQGEIRQRVGELLSETRNKPWLLLDGTDGQIEKVIRAVLDE